MTDLADPRELHGGTWNMERDRNVTRACLQAIGIMRRHKLHFLLLQESADYVRFLAGLAPHYGYRLIYGDTTNGMPETALLVRNDLELEDVAHPRLTFHGWFTVRGGKTPSKWGTAAQLAGWLTVLSVHDAPSVRWHHLRMVGPLLRRLSVRTSRRRELRWARRQQGALLIGGDWNANPGARGRYTPHWLARKAGMAVLAGRRATHGKHSRYDFALLRGCHGHVQVAERNGSDHHLVLFTVVPA